MITKAKSGPLPASSRLLRLAFSMIGRRRLRKSFRAVRMLHPERLRNAGPGPLVVYLNHPSWWDPIVCAELARRLLRGRDHRAPISATALRRYELFGHMGMFPVEQKSSRGAAQFLRMAQAVLASGGVLWITAEGHFTDSRVRPTRLAPGLGALLHRASEALVIPLALEYTFWNQRLPEVLIAAGEPFHVAERPSLSSADWTKMLEEHLQTLQDELRCASMRRDTAAFTTLLEGKRGMGGPYALWQRLRARVRGQRYVADHEAWEEDL